MNKQIKILCMSVLSIFLLQACSKDRLEEEVFSFLSPDNFYNNAAEGYAAVSSISFLFHENSLFRRDAAFILESPTDNHLIGDEVDFERIQLHNYTVDANNSIVRDVYASFYTCIYRANATIENLQNATFPNEEDKKVWQIAEARFYRGFSYFYLVRLFGKVPLITTLEQIDQINQISRAPVDEVYTQIIEDFKFAQENLPDKNTQIKGRPANDVASAFLAEVYLTRSGNEEKIGGGKDEWTLAEAEAKKVIDNGYELFDNFADVFTEANQNSGEIMFSVQYKDPEIDQPAHWWADMSNIKVPMTSELANAFEDGDERINVTFRIDFPGGITIDPKKASEDSLRVAKQFFNNGSVQDFINRPLLRYSDVLLMYAEAINEQGGPNAEAYTALNTVRTRAGLPELSGLGQAEFREAVRKERRLEFVFEFKRYFDLKRWGILIETVNTKFKDKIPDFNAQAHHVLLPIPQDELDRNIGLNGEQNPGY